MLWKTIYRTPKGVQINLTNKQTVFCFIFAGLACIMDLGERFGVIDFLEGAYPITEVYDKTFINERVPLAGFGYHHCKFQNVQLVIDGSAFKTEFHDNSINGIWFVSDDPKIERALYVVDALGFLPLPIVDRDGRVIQPGSGLAPPKTSG